MPAAHHHAQADACPMYHLISTNPTSDHCRGNVLPVPAACPENVVKCGHFPRATRLASKMLRNVTLCTGLELRKPRPYCSFPIVSFSEPCAIRLKSSRKCSLPFGY